MHKALVIITVLAFISGILDLVLNVAILTTVSHGHAVTAISDAFGTKKASPSAMTTFLAPTVTATPSATPKFLIKPTISK